MYTGDQMLLDEVKATLAMENLNLSKEQEKLLQDYAKGLITFEQFKEQLAKLSKEFKAAWILEASTFDKVYCYPGTDILINNFNEHDPKVLSQLEAMVTGARLIDLLKKPILGKFDQKHLQAIHHYIFQDVFSWAGKFRQVNISKEILFCDAQFIQKGLDKIFLQLKQEKYLRDCTSSDIASRAAYYLGELNAIHPFREGNGRTQREFIRELLLPLGFYVDYSRCDPKMMLYASINAFAGDYDLMTELFNKCIIEKPQNLKYGKDI